MFFLDFIPISFNYQNKDTTKATDNQNKTRKRLPQNSIAQAFSEHGKVPPQAVDLEEDELEEPLFTARVKKLKIGKDEVAVCLFFFALMTSNRNSSFCSSMSCLI